MMKRFLQQKNTRMYHVWLRSFIVCLCLALAGVSAWGQEYGNFEVTGENVTYENGILTISGSGVTVKNKDPKTATSDRIVIKGGEEASPIVVTLAGVNMETEEGETPIIIDGHVNLELKNSTKNIINANKNPIIKVYESQSLNIIGDGELSATTFYSNDWGIWCQNSFLSITSGKISVTNDGYGNGIGGNGSTINILGGDITINIKNSGTTALGSSDKTATLHISGGNIKINSIAKSGNTYADCINGKRLETGQKGNAIVVVKNINKPINIQDMSNKEEWNIVILDKWTTTWIREDIEPYNFIAGIDGFVYGKVDFNENIVFDEYNSLLYCSPSKLSFSDGVEVENKGRILISAEKEEENIEGHIRNVGEGAFYYQVFFDEKGMQLPEDVISDLQDYKDGEKDLFQMFKMYISGNEDPEKDKIQEIKDLKDFQGEAMYFAKEDKEVYLRLNKDLTDHGYELEGFTVKTKNGEIPVTKNSFEMPGQAVWITDIKIKENPKPLVIQYWESDNEVVLKDGIEGITMSFKNENGEIATKAYYNDLIHFSLKAEPGYKIEEIAFAQYPGRNITNDLGRDENGSLYYECWFNVPSTPNDRHLGLVMKSLDNHETKVTKIDYSVIVDPKPQNGTILFEVGDETNEKIENAHVNDEIKVVATPNIEGGGLIGGALTYTYLNVNGEKVVSKITNGSFIMPPANVTVTGEFSKGYIITINPSENGSIKTEEGRYTVTSNENIKLISTPNDGYELSELYYVDVNNNRVDIDVDGLCFNMPESDITIYSIFKEKEDPADPEEPVDPPVDPINYYNIYNETTYDFIDVSFSRNVVREGGSINVYLEIPEGLDPAAVTLMFKRSLYGGWENLNTDDDGNYLINNIWTDIYVKAVVDESYIDPNPDENHIYIDLSETNDSIWLYTERKLVEEGKTAVIQAEVAKSCQNKEIRYMYKRTVLGEWKEMPKDYSINQYVVRDITTDIYVKAYFVFDKQDPTTAKNPHHVYADITATCEGLYLDATRHKVVDEGDTKVFLYVKKGFETKDARYQFKRGLKGEWEDLVPGIEQNTFQVTDIEGDIYLKGIDAIYTGTEDIDGMVRVYTKDGSLFVYTAQPEEISVVSMTGVTVKRTRQTGLQSYPLNQGIYVVCVGEQVFKVRVK